MSERCQCPQVWLTSHVCMRMCRTCPRETHMIGIQSLMNRHVFADPIKVAAGKFDTAPSVLIGF